MVAPLTSPSLSALKGIRHAFFTREGGVSQDVYASLNCGLGSADDGQRVAENRSRVARAMGVAADRLVTPFQVHGTRTIVADAPWAGDAQPHGDAVVTRTAGIAIAVGTADCGPVLLADPAARVVGAAHAGWKGALGGVLESAVAAMEGLGANRSRIAAALGPTISQANYEVGPEVVAQFVASDPANASFFIPSLRAGRSLFDLPGYIVGRLRRAGISAEDWGLCTYADADRFFSFRRSTHRGEKDYGRELSAIVLAD